MLCLETGEYLCLNVDYRLSLGEYMNTNLIVAIAASGLLLAGAASAQEKKIKRSDLPPAVEKTVAAQSAGATIRGFSTEKEKGQTLFEVEMTVNGHSKDI